MFSVAQEQGVDLILGLGGSSPSRRSTLGRTFLPFTSQVQSRSMAVSYSPTSVPSGPLMRCNSSWMMRSGGRSGFCGSTLAEGELPLLGGRR